MELSKVVLIDGNNISHAMYHAAKKAAWRSKISEDEMYSFLENMTYHMFFNKFFSLFKEFGKAHYIIAWDAAGATTWRREQVEEYKANRVHTSEVRDVLFLAMDNLRTILNHFPIYQMHIPGYEADDVIYKIASEANGEVVIVSNDQDMQQIAQKFGSKIFNPIKKEYVVSPEDYDICVYKALVGDKSDNIPGIKGVGVKSAEKIARSIYNNEIDNSTIRPYLKSDADVESFMRYYSIIDIASKPTIKDLIIDWKYIQGKKEFDFESIMSFFRDHKMKSQIGSFEKNKKVLLEYT